MKVDVCVVGAGFAGLMAARDLTRGGRSVALLEARDRVGGRTFSRQLQGVPIELGGTWIGGPQERVYAVAAEYGKSTHPTFEDGDKLFVSGGSCRRYKRSVAEVAPGAAEMAEGLRALDRMSRELPLEAPWDAPHAHEWDRMTTSAWIDLLGLDPVASTQLSRWLVTLMTADLSEVSLLMTLYLVRSAGSMRTLLATKGGYQQDHIDTGTHSVAVAIAEELGDSLWLRTPVRRVAQSEHGVELSTDEMAVGCERAVLALPLALAGSLRYEPPVPLERAFLHQRALGGSVCKVVAAYETPFWREQGLSGESFSFHDMIGLTMDVSPPDARLGLLMCFAYGPDATAFGRLDPASRRSVVVEALASRFGPPAGDPLELFEQDWGKEEFSRGGYMAHFPPGALTQYGREIGKPWGRIHWAGSETSPICLGSIDGAIRSGERAAREVLAALG